MTKYLIYSALLFLCSVTMSESVEYQLINPNDAGEQYLSIIDSVVFYHGRVSRISTDSSLNSSVYFLSKAIKSESNQKGMYTMKFSDFQYADELLPISDFDSTKFQKGGERISLDIYNSMWGELNGDTITLRATKHFYDSRSDKVTFVRHISK